MDIWILYYESSEYDDYYRVVEGVFASREVAEAVVAARPCRGRKGHPLTWIREDDEEEEVYWPSCTAQGHEGFSIQCYPVKQALEEAK